MGVHGLWKLLEPAGKPVPVESLENKVLAVDVSVWLHQLTKGFQTASGGSVPNAHLIGLFNRICKLLYYRIKPVFVFDGGVPNLKKSTIESRKKKQRKANDASSSIREELLKNVLKRTAVGQLMGEDEEYELPFELQHSDDQGDMFALPTLPEHHNLESDESEESEDEVVAGATIDSLCYHQLGRDLHSVDVSSPLFKSMPADIRHEILSELLENRKQNSWANVREMPEDSGDFSDFQMRRLLKRRDVQVSLNEAATELSAKSTSLGELEARFIEDGIVTGNRVVSESRIAGDDVTRYVYITGEKYKEAINGKSHSANVESSSDIVTENKNTAIRKSRPNLPVRSIRANNINLPSTSYSDKSINPISSGYESDDEYEVDNPDCVEDFETQEALSQREILEIIREQSRSTKLTPQMLKYGEKNNTTELQSPDDANFNEIIELNNEQNKRNQMSNSNEIIERIGTRSFDRREVGRTECVETFRENKCQEEMIADILKSYEKYSQENRAREKSSERPEIAAIREMLSTEYTVGIINPNASEFKDSNKEFDSNSEKFGLSIIPSKDFKGKKNVEHPTRKNVDTNISSETSPSNITEKFDENSSLYCSMRLTSKEVKYFGNEKSVRENDKVVKLRESSEESSNNTLSKTECISRTDEIKDFPIKLRDDTQHISKHNQIEKLSDSLRSEFNEVTVTNEIEELRDNALPTPEKTSATISPTNVNHGNITSPKTSDSHSHTEYDSDTDSDDFVEVGEEGELIVDKSDNNLSNKCEIILSKSDVKSGVEISIDRSALQPDDIFSDVFGSRSVSNDNGSSLPENSVIKDIDVFRTRKLNELQNDLDTEQIELLMEHGKQERLGKTITQQMTLEAQELLSLFGLPYIVAPMEAESQCAFLDNASLTEGTITDDSDIWLFGGRYVYKNFFDNRKFVAQYRASDIEQIFKLTRAQMVQLALLVGSDYTNGLPGVGPVTAMEILALFSKKTLDGHLRRNDIIAQMKKFHDWKESKISFLAPQLAKKLKDVRISGDFPNPEVVDSYLNPVVDPSKERFSWAKPDIDKIKRYVASKFGWKTSRIDEILEPIMKRLVDTNKQKTLDGYFSHKITLPKELSVMSKRVRSAVNKMNVERNLPDLESNYVENEDDGRRIVDHKRKKKNVKSNAKEVLSTSEVIPQREKDRQEAAKRKLQAVKILNSKRTARNKKVKGNAIRKSVSIKLSESSESDDEK